MMADQSIGLEVSCTVSAGATIGDTCAKHQPCAIEYELKDITWGKAYPHVCIHFDGTVQLIHGSVVSAAKLFEVALLGDATSALRDYKSAKISYIVKFFSNKDPENFSLDLDGVMISSAKLSPQDKAFWSIIAMDTTSSIEL